MGADAAIALEYLFADIGGLGAKLPLVNAELRAERETASRDFEGTPAAEAATIRAAWDEFAVDPTALHGPHGAHRLFLNRAMELAGRITRRGTKFDTLVARLDGTFRSETRMAARERLSASE